MKLSVITTGLLFAVSGIYADMLFSDAFSGTTLGTGWTSGDQTVDITVSDDSVHLLSGSTANAVRALIRRNSDAEGNTTFGANNKAVYNFFDHDITISADIGSLGGSVSGTSRISYFLGVCYASAANNMVALGADEGVFVAVDLNSTGYRILTYETTHAMAATSPVIKHVGYLDAAPSNLTVTFDGNSWGLSMGGANFTQGAFTGTSAASGSFTEIQESDFVTDFYLSAGFRQIATADTAGSMDIDHIEVTTSIPEPKAALLIFSSMGVILMVRKMRGQ